MIGFYNLNYERFTKLLHEEPEYDAAIYEGNWGKKRANFFKIVCKAKKIEDCGNMSVDEILDLMTNAEDILGNESEYSKKKDSLICALLRSNRMPRRRLL